MITPSDTGCRTFTFGLMLNGFTQSVRRELSLLAVEAMAYRDAYAVAFASFGLTSSLSSNSSGAGCPESCTNMSAATKRDGTSVMVMPALMVSDAIPGFKLNY